MQRLQAYKYELRPNGQQARHMRRFAGACRFVFNKALALQKERYAHGDKTLGYAELCMCLTGWRHSPDTVWLADAPVHPLQQSLRDLARAYANFFARRAAFPRFKKKGQRDSFRYPDPQQIHLDPANNRIFLPKLGWMRYRHSRPVLGTVKTVTVSASAGRWFVSIHTAREVETPVHPATTIVGVDLGVANFATLSTGEVLAPTHALKRHARRLARAQRALSRKRKFSRNWIKAKARLQHLQARVGNVRRDFLHKRSTMLSKNHACIVVEDLRVRNLSKSASGTVAHPGTHVRAKAGLNRAILDQGWFEFRRQLEYKQGWRGGRLIAVPPMNTSRTCPACGHVAKANRPTQARFACVACGYTAHADVVAAQNILAAGHAVMACGGDVRPSRGARHETAPPAKQEPTEAIPSRPLHGTR
jgi:putative transposase